MSRSSICLVAAGCFFACSDETPAGGGDDSGMSMGMDRGVVSDAGADGGNTDPDGGATDPDGGATDPDGGATDPDGGTVDGAIADAAMMNGDASTSTSDCEVACATFLSTGCTTAAADFCMDAVTNCRARSDGRPLCRAEIDAFDACAAMQPAVNFTCPLGTTPNEANPYRLTEDACVSLRQALIDCLEQ